MAVSLSASQVAVVDTLLGVCKQYNAPPVVQVAMICAGMLESTLSTTADNGTYWGALSGSHTNFPNQSDTVGMATSFLQGGRGFRSALQLASSGMSDPLAIASQSEGATPFDSNGISDQYKPEAVFSSLPAAAQAIVQQYGGGGGVPKGGVAGLGGTGTVASSQGLTSQLTIGGVGNQDENYWVGCNRIASAVYWYFYSDGERLYYMDGADLISQIPAAYIDRVADSDRIQRFRVTWDNSSYQWATTHRRKGRVQHHAKLAKVTSPTEAQLDLVCPIDFYRAGDVVVLESFGPGDGRWLVADCTRSVFSVFSSLTLVPPIMPLSEAEAAGTTGGTAGVKGTSMVNPKTGTPTGSTGTLVSPFSSLHVPSGRTDEGVDFGIQNGMSVGEPIFAIGDCYLVNQWTFYAGEPIMAFKFADASVGHWGWYVSEQIIPQVPVNPGRLIKAGTTVARYAASGTGTGTGTGTGIEIGWAGDSSHTEAQTTSGYTEGQVTPSGSNFRAFLVSVGATK